MWGLFKRRHKEDLRRLVSAYRYFLKAAHQADHDALGDEDREWRKWKGGFAKAFNQFFNKWPTPNQSRAFEKKMLRWLKKSQDMDHTFIQAFNNYLKQKQLTLEELHEVIKRGQAAYRE